MRSPVSIAGIFVVAVAVLSAILTALYAFQQEGWRELLSLSSAENGSIAVCLLGAALMFRQDGSDRSRRPRLDRGASSSRRACAGEGRDVPHRRRRLSRGRGLRAVQRGILGAARGFSALGALFAAMSLAAMPPQAGFVSEWYLFQTFFQGFHLSSLASRLTAALAGAGLALTAAIAFATFIKVFGIGLLGRGGRRTAGRADRERRSPSAFWASGACARGRMPVWLTGAATHRMRRSAVRKMHVGWRNACPPPARRSG